LGSAFPSPWRLRLRLRFGDQAVVVFLFGGQREQWLGRFFGGGPFRVARKRQVDHGLRQALVQRDGPVGIMLARKRFQTDLLEFIETRQAQFRGPGTNW
jgi:hypothetical protein